MCQTIEMQITRASTKARNLLGQLGPLAWALHVMRQPAGAFAVCVDREPRRYVEIHTTEVETERERRQQSVVDLLRELGGSRSGRESDLFESTGYRATINRSIVVYAVSVLEEFVDRAGRRLWTDPDGETSRRDKCQRKSGWPVSFGGMVDHLKSVGANMYGCEQYPQAALFALYRHKIVHADGRVDDKLLAQVADIDKKSGKDIGFRLSGDESSVVWVPCGGQALCSSWVSKSLSLSIDEVVLPLLRASQAFVSEAEAVLLNVATNDTSASRPPG